MALGWYTRGAVAFLVGLSVGCGGGTTKQKPRPAASDAPIMRGVEDGELALTVGDPVRAIRILQSVQSDDDDYAYAQQLLEDARADAAAIVRTLLGDVDAAIGRKRFTTAEARCRYLLDNFPLEEEAKSRVISRLTLVEEGRAAAGKELAHIEAQARDLMLTNDLTGAIRVLKGARAAAWDSEPERALDWERMIAAADAHLQLATLDRGEGNGKEGAARRRALRRRRGDGGHTIEPAAAATPNWEAEKRDHEVRALLNEAKTAAKRNSHFVAIKNYELVLKKVPFHAEATAALKSLDPKREKLIREYLAKADQYFLAQDLGSAAPYYEKVLILRPGHKRATDRLRAHETLEKIRSRKKK